MKNLLLIISIAFLSTNLFAQDVKNIFDSNLGAGNYTVVSINGALFELATSMSKGNNEANDVAKDIDGIRILSAEDLHAPKAKAQLLKDLKAFFKQSNYIEFMRVEDKEEKVMFYLRKSGKQIVELTLHVENESTVIQINGDIDLNNISGLSKSINIQGMDKLEKIDKEENNAK